MAVEAEAEKPREEEENGVAVVDFDMLCATVALQTQGFSVEKRGREGEGEEDEGGGEFGGVQRMWEGDVLDCFEDRRIAIEAACCPCYSFGKNMRRANLGSCFVQDFRDPWLWSSFVDKGAVYFILSVIVLFSFIALGITKQHGFLYMGVAAAFSIGLYAGYFRTRIRKQFNIKGGDSSLDDCVNHLICPSCMLCQESRTLEMNNVQDGVWHGRGDTICLGSAGEGSKEFSVLCKPPLMPNRSPELCSMQRAANGGEQSWNADVSQSEPLVPTAQHGLP